MIKLMQIVANFKFNSLQRLARARLVQVATARGVFSIMTAPPCFLGNVDRFLESTSVSEEHLQVTFVR